MAEVTLQNELVIHTNGDLRKAARILGSRG